MERILPGRRRWPCCSAKSQAAVTAKQGFRNSEGCSESPARSTQRRAPLISCPAKRVTAVSASAIRSPSIATLLEACELIEGGGGRREQHHRAGPMLGRGIAHRGGDRAVQRSALPRGDAMGPQPALEIRRRLADQIGARDAGKVRLETVEPG